MKVFYTGFNLYQQFNKSTFSVVENFTEAIYENCLDIIFSHTFSIVVDKNEVMYYGSKQNKFVLPKDFRIKQLACADKIISVNEAGQLFMLDSADFLTKPLLPHIKDRFSKITCGNKNTVALTEKGELYNLPNKLTFVNEDVVDIKSGCEHCLLLNKHGDVYSFGSGSRGQLGHGHLENEIEPTLIQALAGIKINKIAAGGWHSCAISIDGDCYIWGWNNNGQLGICNDEEIVSSVFALPQIVDIDDESANVVQVACGKRHTVILLDNGKLYGAGWNKYYQLGKLSGSKKENILRMSFLQDFSTLLSEKNKATLKCGPWCTAIVIH